MLSRLSSFLILLKAAHIFVMAADHSRRLAFRLYRSRAEADAGDQVCQDLLESWLSNLPRTLILDDNNLSEAHHLQACEGGDAWGWSFSMMHIFVQMAVALIEGGCATSSTLMTLTRTPDADSRKSTLSIFPFVLVAHDGLVNPSPYGREVSGALATAQSASDLSTAQIERIVGALGFAPGGPAGAPGRTLAFPMSAVSRSLARGAATLGPPVDTPS